MRLLLQLLVDGGAETELLLEGECCLLAARRSHPDGRPEAGPGAVSWRYVQLYEQAGSIWLQCPEEAAGVRVNDLRPGARPCRLFDDDRLHVGELVWRVTGAGAPSPDTGEATEFYVYPEEQASGTDLVDSSPGAGQETRCQPGRRTDGRKVLAPCESEGEATAVDAGACGPLDETRLAVPEGEEPDATCLLPEETALAESAARETTAVNPLGRQAPEHSDSGSTRLDSRPELDAMDIEATLLDDAGKGEPDGSLTEAAGELRPMEAGVEHDSALLAGSGPGDRRGRRWWLPLLGLAAALGSLLWLVLWLVMKADRPPQVPESSPVPSIASGSAGRLREPLAAGDLAMLPAQLLRQHLAQPGVVETRRLLEDANRLQDLLYLRDSGRWRDFAELRGRSFHGEQFEQAARQWLDPKLMSVASMRRYNQAARAWREGRLVEALNGMRSLAREAPDSPAAAALQHYRRVVEGADELAGLVADEGYAATLLAHYLALDPWDDAFYWSRLSTDLSAAKPPLPAEWGEPLATLGQQWMSYQRGGGITSALRQQPGGSAGFRQRAGELRDACRALGRLVGLAGAASLPPDLFARGQPGRLRTELDYQRGRLQALLSVNEVPAFRQRLDSLPSSGACPDA